MFSRVVLLLGVLLALSDPKCQRLVYIGVVLKKALLTVACLLSFLITVAYFQMPTWVAEDLHRRAPYLKAGQVELDWSGPRIILRNTTVDKLWITGTLTTITIDARTKTVEVRGGHLDVNLDKRPSGGGSPGEGSGVSLKSFQIDTANVTAKGVKAHLKRLKRFPEAYQIDSVNAIIQRKELEPYKAFFPEATANVHLIGVSVRRDLKGAIADHLRFAVVVPETIPQMGGTHILGFEGVSVSVPDKWFRADRMGMNNEGRDSDVDAWIEGQSVNIGPEDATIGALEVRNNWIAPHTVRLKQLRVHSDGRLKVGENSLFVSLKDRRINGKGSCSDWARSFPEHQQGDGSFKPLFEHPDAFVGDLSFYVSLNPPEIEMSSTCKYTCSESPLKELKKGKFSYEAYKSDGTIFTRETGPKTEDWVSLLNLPPHTPEAFVTLEDPSFLRHKGVLVPSLRVALEQNLEKGEFFRGGSTITQQLAKNLWLKRHKTLGRKAEEALLTWALESCLSKEAILELYLNVVEFGPDTYGVGPGTKYRFGKKTSELLPLESFYLANSLPNPRTHLAPDKGGLKQAERVMASLAKRGLLSQHMLLQQNPPDATGWDSD